MKQVTNEDVLDRSNMVVFPYTSEIASMVIQIISFVISDLGLIVKLNFKISKRAC